MPDMDQLDSKLLYELDINSRLSVSQLAHRLKRSKETINFRLKRLLKNKVVKSFYTMFDVLKVGGHYFKFYLKFRNITPKLEQEIMSYLSVQNGIIYLASMEGYYNCVVLVTVSDPRDLTKFLYPFMRLYGQYIHEKQMVIFISTHRLNQRFLYAGEKTIDRHFSLDSKPCKIDETDLKIMQLLSSNARISTVEIAEHVNLEPASIRYRIKRLKMEGIILGHAVSLNYDTLGLRFVQINISLIDPSSKKSMLAYFDGTNKCLFAIDVVGRYDLVIEVFIKDKTELTGIVDGFRDNFSDKYYDFDISTITKEYVVLWLPQI